MRRTLYDYQQSFLDPGCYCHLLNVIKPCSKVLKVTIRLTPNTRPIEAFNQIQPVGH